MFLLWVAESNTNSVKKELPCPNLQIDPRPISSFLTMPPLLNLDTEQCVSHIKEGDTMTFELTYHDNGTTVTITRTDDSDEDDGWVFDDLRFRVYDPAKEVVPSFESTIYTYEGVDDEVAPLDTTVGIIGPAVKVIKREAFFECKKMRICLMEDGVETIEECAFFCCKALTTIRLSRNLKRIGRQSFGLCESLDALFIPSSLEHIKAAAFSGCTNIRILSLPPTIDIQQIGHGIVRQCRTLFEIIQIQTYDERPSLNGRDPHFFHNLFRRGSYINSEQVRQSLIDFNRNRPPLHKTCLDTNISALKVHDCIRTHGQATAYARDNDGMTPLHILCMNPHATPGSVIACLHQNINAAFAKDLSEMTPVDYLRKYENGECLIALFQALCIHRESYMEIKTSKSEYWSNKKVRVD